MKSDQILDTLESIAATASTKEKLNLLTSAVLSAETVEVLSYAYNPFTTFGLIDLPERTQEGVLEFSPATWELLDRLADRKLTGTAALEAVKGELDSLTEKSAELLRRILRKNLRAGISESTINKAVRGLIPEFAYQRCSLPKDVDLDGWPWNVGVISQEKADGMYVNIDHEVGGIVRITSRQGSPFPIEAFPFLVEEVRHRLLPDHEYQGEMLVKKAGEILPRADSNGVMNSILSGGSFADDEEPVFFAWNMIPLACAVKKGSCNVAYTERWSQLLSQLATLPGSVIKPIPSRAVFSRAEAYAHAAELMKAGKEGTIIKHPHGTWQDTGSAGSKYLVKIKLEFLVELEVVKINHGAPGTKLEGKPATFSCKSSDDLLNVDITIKNEKLRAAVTADPEGWLGRIITARANDITEPGENNEKHSLYLARMDTDTYRADRLEADDLPRIKAAKEAAILGQALVA